MRHALELIPVEVVLLRGFNQLGVPIIAHAIVLYEMHATVHVHLHQNAIVIFIFHLSEKVLGFFCYLNVDFSLFSFQIVIENFSEGGFVTGVKI